MSSNLLMKLLWPPHFTWKTTANFTVLCVTFFNNDEILGGKFSQYSFLKGLEGWGGGGGGGGDLGGGDRGSVVCAHSTDSEMLFCL